jgi:hypothetical protein
MANPMKGIPRADWPKVMAERAAKATTELADAMNAATTEPPKSATPSALPSGSTKPPKESEPPPRNLMTGDIKHLEVWGKNGSNTDPIPGYRLHWFLDRDGTGSRMFLAKRSGYDFVMQDEVMLNDLSENLDEGSQVKVYGGVSPAGTPIFHWLMKKPNWLNEQHQKDMQKVPDRIEQELRRGTLGKTPDDGRYTRETELRSNIPEIKIS